MSWEKVAGQARVTGLGKVGELVHLGEEGFVPIIVLHRALSPTPL